MDAGREVDRLGLAVERREPVAQGGAGGGGKERAAVELEGVGLGFAADLALVRAEVRELVDVSAGFEADREAGRVVTQNKTRTQGRGDMDVAALVGPERHAEEVRGGEGEGPRGGNLTRSSRSPRSFLLGRALRARGGDRRTFDLQTFDLQPFDDVRGNRRGCGDGAVGGEGEYEREIGRFVLIDEEREETGGIERAEEVGEGRVRAARAGGERGGAEGEADGRAGRGRRFGGEAAGLGGEEDAVFLPPRVERAGRGEVAVLLDEAALVHRLHADEEARRAVARGEADHVAQRRGRRVARAAGEEFRDAARGGGAGGAAQKRERVPLRAGGVGMGPDFVDAGDGEGAEGKEGVAVAADGVGGVVLGVEVSGEEEAACVAPAADGVEVGAAEARAVEAGIGGPDVRRGAVRGAAGVEPALHVGAEGAARRGGVFLLQPGPGAEARGRFAAREVDAHVVAGLVGEDADDGAVGQPRREALRVDLVREREEAGGGGGLADVHPAARAEGALPVPAAAGAREDAALGVAPGVVFGGNASAAGAARAVELVVEPDL